MSSDSMDDRIAALLAVPEREPDEAFVLRVERALLADRRLAAQRSAAWRRFRGEAAASLAVVAAFALLWRGAPDALPVGAPMFSPAAAAVLILFLWFALGLKPAVSAK